MRRNCAVLVSLLCTIILSPFATAEAGGADCQPPGNAGIVLPPSPEDLHAACPDHGFARVVAVPPSCNAREVAPGELVVECLPPKCPPHTPPRACPQWILPPGCVVDRRTNAHTVVRCDAAPPPVEETELVLELPPRTGLVFGADTWLDGGDIGLRFGVLHDLGSRRLWSILPQIGWAHREGHGPGVLDIPPRDPWWAMVHPTNATEYVLGVSFVRRVGKPELKILRVPKQ